MALLQLRSDLDIFSGYCKLDALKQHLCVVARRLRDSFLLLCDATKTLRQGAIEAKDIHAPLNCRRTSLRTLQWKPFFVVDVTTRLQSDFVALVHSLVEVKQHSNKVLPILVDENIHYRLCKMMYSKSYAQYNLALFLCLCPVLYAVWHPYKYAITVCSKRFFRLFVGLTQGRLPSGMEVYPHPKFIYIERLMTAPLVLVSSCKPSLERLKASTSDSRPNMSERHRTTIALVKGMVVLLLEYIPAQFLCGFRVRNCNWANQHHSIDAL